MTTINIYFALKDPRVKHKRPLQNLVKKLLTFIIDSEKLAHLILDISFVDETTIQNLNYQYRKKNYPTNILSFAESLALPDDNYYLGSLILCLPIIQAEAMGQSKSFHDHLTHLLLHGCLHLLGYNHEKKREAKVMEALEVNILKKLAIGNPYE